ncbi:MAG: hypothetical protein Q7U36_01650 [bacterium]|nr:hypothetical protein [bacterium]
MSDDKRKDVVGDFRKKPFAEVIQTPPVDFSEAIKRANLKKGGADRFAQILTVYKKIK